LKEIEILSPKFVVFLTSGWEWGFVKSLNKNQEPEWIASHKWGNEYEVRICKVNDTYFIRSLHPQGKNEHQHARIIAKIIESYSVSDLTAEKTEAALN
jgi:hypothetical protein